MEELQIDCQEQILRTTRYGGNADDFSGAIPTICCQATRPVCQVTIRQVTRSKAAAYSPKGGRSCLFSPLVLQITEKIRIGLQHHDISTILETGLVGVEAAIEGIEFCILAVGVGVDLSGFGVPFTT